MALWLFEANQNAQAQPSIERILRKSETIYLMLNPDPVLEQQTKERIGQIEAEIAKIRTFPLGKALDTSDAAFGCIWGGLVGEAAGATLELVFHQMTQQEVTRAMAMPGGGMHQVSPGQITDDGELTMAQAQVLAAGPTLDTMAQKYVDWLKSGPFDIGGTTLRAFGCHNVYEWKKKIEGIGLTMLECAAKRNSNSLSNGALMRATSLAIWGYRLPVAELKAISFFETALTNPNETIKVAVFCYRLSITHLLKHQGDYKGAFDLAVEWATKLDPEVVSWLREAEKNHRIAYLPEAGQLRIGFTHAYRHLLLQTDYYDAINETLLGGGDTDTNGIIVGALLGACYGQARIPPTMKAIVKGCTTNKNGKSKDRPDWMQPIQVDQVFSALLAQAPDSYPEVRFIPPTM